MTTYNNVLDVFSYAAHTLANTLWSERAFREISLFSLDVCRFHIYKITALCCVVQQFLKMNVVICQRVCLRVSMLLVPQMHTLTLCFNEEKCIFVT